MNRHWASASARRVRRAKKKERERQSSPQESKMMAAWSPGTWSLEKRKQTLEKEEKLRPGGSGLLKTEQEFAAQKKKDERKFQEGKLNIKQ